MSVSHIYQPVAVARPLGVIVGRPALQKKIANTFLIGIPFAGSVGSLFWFRSHPIHAVEVVTFILGYFVIGMGTGIGFHRYFSHKSFQTYPWVAYLLGAAGSMSFQSSLLIWVTDHRRHHSQADHCGDAHSPIVDGHCHDTRHPPRPLPRPHRLDVRRHRHRPQHLRPRPRARPHHPVLTTAPTTSGPSLSLAIPWLIGYAFGGLADAWGCLLAACLRTMLFQHSVWAVNSFGHTFGYQNYNMGNNSKNNVFLAAVTFGDGYHNNHHRYPRSAFHGLRKYEFDFNGILITWLGKLGLARKIIFADHYLDEERPVE